MATASRLWTTGQIAPELNTSVFRVHYIVKTRGIMPAYQHGTVRLFDEDGFQAIRRAVEAINSGVGDRRRRKAN